MDIPDATVRSQSVWGSAEDAELEDAVDAANNSRIVIMNPPFTNRAKMGEKFPKHIQQLLRKRVDAMERNLVSNDKELVDFVDKNSIATTMFVALVRSSV